MLCRQEDSVAQEVFQIMGREAARALVYLTDVFAPEVVILSGEGLDAGSALTDTIYREWAQYGARMPFRPVQWVLDSWDNFHWARSAASLVFDELIFPGAIKVPVLGP
jgi:predicted NBD/HSP70 family sugar kinase